MELKFTIKINKKDIPKEGFVDFVLIKPIPLKTKVKKNCRVKDVIDEWSIPSKMKNLEFIN